MQLQPPQPLRQLNLRLDDVPGIGLKTKQELNNLDINSVHDLIWNLPRKYTDFTNVIKLRDIKEGRFSTIAHFTNIATLHSKKGKNYTRAILEDETNQISVFWFNQPYIRKTLSENVDYIVSGEYKFNAGRFSVISPVVEKVSENVEVGGKITPVYSAKKDLKSTTIRKVLNNSLKLIENYEPLPAELITANRLMPFATSINLIHFPSKDDLQNDLALRRLGHDELFYLALAGQVFKAKKGELSQKIDTNLEGIKKLVASLPFRLTDNQRIVIWDILQKINSEKPLNCLLQGDVGSGKTIVAIVAMYVNLLSNGQSVVMVPTEILAEQHYLEISKRLKPLGVSESSIALLTGSTTKTQKANIAERLENGDIKILIGTHSLIEKKPEFKNLNLIVIDEQHRFGVEQRKLLVNKAAKIAHTICMTATPIPRTLALTLFNQMEVISLKGLPSNRTPITNHVIKHTNRYIGYDEAAKQIKEGRQAYIVCPLIEGQSDKRTTKVVIAEIQKNYPRVRIAELHGKMKSKQKEEVLREFNSGKIDLLVSTTVIEVGINVPNSTVMIIENAERFGLAQLHQLRGRVGRGNHPGTCYFVVSDGFENSKRMLAIKNTNDGFKLSDYDLKIRGPGSLYGAMQHGALDLKIANFNDKDLISLAKHNAKIFLEQHKMSDYPDVATKVGHYLKTINLN